MEQQVSLLELPSPQPKYWKKTAGTGCPSAKRWDSLRRSRRESIQDPEYFQAPRLESYLRLEPRGKVVSFDARQPRNFELKPHNPRRNSNNSLQMSPAHFGSDKTLPSPRRCSPTQNSGDFQMKELLNALANVNIVASDAITFADPVSITTAGVGLTATATNAIKVASI